MYPEQCLFRGDAALVPGDSAGRRDIEAAATFYGRVLGIPGRRVRSGGHYSTTPGGGRVSGRHQVRVVSSGRLGGVAGGRCSPECGAEECQRDSADDDERRRVDRARAVAAPAAPWASAALGCPGRIGRQVAGVSVAPGGRSVVGRWAAPRRGGLEPRLLCESRVARRPSLLRLRSGLPGWPVRPRWTRQTRSSSRPACRVPTSPWHRRTPPPCPAGWASPGRCPRRRRSWRPRPPARPSSRAGHGPRCRGRDRLLQRLSVEADPDAVARRPPASARDRQACSRPRACGAGSRRHPPRGPPGRAAARPVLVRGAERRLDVSPAKVDGKPPVVRHLRTTRERQAKCRLLFHGTPFVRAAERGPQPRDVCNVPPSSHTRRTTVSNGRCKMRGAMSSPARGRRVLRRER